MGDGAGLIQQQYVDVSGGLNGPTGECNDVLLEEAVHAGNADSRQQGGNGGGGQADKKRHQDGQGHRRALSGGLDAVDGERADVGADQQKDKGQSDQQHLQGGLV